METPPWLKLSACVEAPMGVGIFDFSKESFCGDPPHGLNYKFAWKRHCGVGIFGLVGNPFVETPAWLEL